MLKVKNLIKRYGERTVLNISSLTVNKGEFVVVVGPNGSGKSTLLKILAGTLQQTSGNVETDSRIYYLPQQSTPFGKSVRKNLLFASNDKKDREKRCEYILGLLRLTELSEKKAKGLSGGESQRLSLGRILMNTGDFLLLDEPSSAADIEGAEIIENALKEYRKETGCGILMTTHSPKQAKDLADRIIILNGGEIAEEGSPEELLGNPSTVWGKKFIDSWKIDG